MKEKSGKRNPGGEIMEQVLLEAFGKHLGSSWEASEKHLGTYGRHLGKPSLQESLRDETLWKINISL